jgi:hypothetical protein
MAFLLGYSSTRDGPSCVAWVEEVMLALRASEASCPVGARHIRTLEPHMGYWHLRDLILMTPAGLRLLSDRFRTDEMVVID